MNETAAKGNKANSAPANAVESNPKHDMRWLQQIVRKPVSQSFDFAGRPRFLGGDSSPSASSSSSPSASSSFDAADAAAAGAGAGVGSGFFRGRPRPRFGLFSSSGGRSYVCHAIDAHTWTHRVKRKRTQGRQQSTSQRKSYNAHLAWPTALLPLLLTASAGGSARSARRGGRSDGSCGGCGGRWHSGDVA